MLFIKKLFFLIFSIFTLGFLPLVFFKIKKIKKSDSEKKDLKIGSNAKKIVSFLSGKKNILGCEYTLNKIKIFLDSKDNIDLESLKKIKIISGLVSTKNWITIIVGKRAPEISREIIEWIKL